MAKFLLAALTAALLGVDAHAEDVAGGPPPLPPLPGLALPPLPGPGIVTQTTKTAWRVALRLKGVALGAFIQTGMTTDQVEQIVGDCALKVEGLRFNSSYYFDLGLVVTYRVVVNATGHSTSAVDGVSLKSILER